MLWICSVRVVWMFGSSLCVLCSCWRGLCLACCLFSFLLGWWMPMVSAG